VGIPLILILLFWSKFAFALTVVVITFGASIEFYRLISAQSIMVNRGLGLAFGATMPLAALYYHLPGLIAWFVLASIATLTWKILSPTTHSSELALTILGIFYPSLLLSYLVLINNLPSGAWLVFYTLIATWVADSSAYFIGKWFGKTPLAKQISPGKTVEGVAGSIAVNLILFSVLVFMPYFQLAQRLIFALLISIAAVVGDLVESVLKREAGVKDAGNLIPGHGGFLDRFDSLIFTAVVSFYIALQVVR
jgi:phosphatidate cytidylyltransferase